LQPQKNKDRTAKILDPDYRKKVLSDYDSLEEKLGGTGASEKTARLIVRNLK
jgi:lipid-A-disaccharide synthase